MKKKLALLLAAAMCIASLTACGANADKKENKGSGASNVTSNGYAFEVSGTALVVDSEFDQYKDKLGKEDKYFESASCGFGDLDKQYTYKGFQVDTYQVDKKDYVSCVTLKDDTVKTKEGVAIGASADEITKAYGEAKESSDSQITYEKDSMKLIFVMKDGKAISIQYATLKNK